MKTIGRLSEGIDLGWRRGFDSGLSLGYVYANEPRGPSRLARAIDAHYRNSIGWRGVRQRKANLENALRSVIATLAEQGRAVRIFDIAAGAGRYTLETIHAMPGAPITAVLRDYKAENIAAAQRRSMNWPSEV